MRIPPFKVFQKTYFNDFFNENYDFENYHKDINYQNFYIYYKNEKQFYNANEEIFIKKKKDFKNDEINVEFVSVMYYIIIKKKENNLNIVFIKRTFFQTIYYTFTLRLNLILKNIFKRILILESIFKRILILRRNLKSFL